MNRIFGLPVAFVWRLRSAVLVRARRARYPEDGHDPVRAGDLDLSDEHLDQSLALPVVACADDVFDVVGDLPEGGRRRRGWIGCELLCQLVPLAA
jgi:hypothetical protein